MTKQEAAERAELAHWKRQVASKGPEWRRPDIFLAGRESLEPLVEQLVAALPKDCCGITYAERIAVALAAARDQGFGS